MAPNLDLLPGLTEDALDTLRTQGHVVVDGFLKAEHAERLLEEARAFGHSGRMPKHKFQFGNAQVEKPNIYEADMHNEALQEELPAFADLLFDDSIAKVIAASYPDLKLDFGPTSKTIKLQRNAGSGGCFPCHYDNAGVPSKRAVTCVVYLNPEWQQGDGGEVVLTPFLEPEVIIPPLMNRAVFFLSDRILHRVLPAVKERFCFSIWFDSTDINRQEDCNLTAKHLSTEPEAIDFLKTSPVQRAISRSVYAEEYEVSLRECMAHSPAAEAMLQAHMQQVVGQRKNPQLGPFLEHLRSLKPRELRAIS
mmetsp:Transcript_11841/g.26120  ORF Transcript_11841/g.26120 Transcript_11841/m.26120 type:complete len:307 (-) Transcript_11841:296-1216(-)